MKKLVVSCRVVSVVSCRSPIRFFDPILNNALALRASQNRGKLPRGVCLCTAKSTKSTKSRLDGGEIARCGPLHHHRTIRRLWCAAFAPFRKPDAPNRTRPDARNGRVRTRPSGFVRFLPNFVENSPFANEECAAILQFFVGNRPFSKQE